jgi:glycosyltransferase involved in cell wall biosynthesis
VETSVRIAVLTHGSSPFGVHYGRAFQALGHPVDLLSLSHVESETPGLPYRVVGPEEFRPRETASRLAYLRTIGPVRRAIREIRPDILLALYLSSAGLVGCLSGHPCVVVSALGSDVNTRIDRPLWRWLFRWECRRARLVHAVSEPLAETLRGRFGVDPGKILVAPIGVDTRHVPLVDPASRPNAGQVLCTRAHLPLYDQDTLVRAMARLKARGAAAHLTFTSTKAVERTRGLVRDLGVEDRVTFREDYTYEEMPAVLAAADVYVSCSRSDGTSSSLLEAMSSGLFPVVSDIPANRPWIEDGRSGLLFPVGDDAALAERLAEVLAMPERRAAASPINHQIVLDRGDLMTEARRMIAAFEKCLRQ